jgi:pimeloyl-ACP methyl ester carboxylesterase
VEAAAATLTMPVAMLCGDRDPFFSIVDARRGAERFHGATFTALAGVGHFPQLEAPDRVAATIAEHARSRAVR